MDKIMVTRTWIVQCSFVFKKARNANNWCSFDLSCSCLLIATPHFTRNHMHSILATRLMTFPFKVLGLNFVVQTINSYVNLRCIGIHSLIFDFSFLKKKKNFKMFAME